MKQPRMLIYGVVAAGVLTVGTIGIRAAPTCERIVKVYRERIVHHHVSKETAYRWAVWAKAHPNYRPKRKPPLSPQETLDKLAIACEVPLIPQQFAGLLPPEEESSLLTTEADPVYIATSTPAFTLVGTPLNVSPLVPTDDLPTPEPASWILLGSALGLLLFWKRSVFLKPSGSSIL